MKTRLVVLAGVSALGSTATAATITVNSTSDDAANISACTLRDAVTAANTDAVVDGCGAGAGADVILIPAGTYTLTQGQLNLNTEITVRGAGATQTIVDGNNASRVVNIGSSAIVTWQRVAVTRGRLTSTGIGGGAFNAGVLIASDCLFDSNVASYQGGGVNVSATGTATFTRCVFQNNSGTAAGGAAISVDGGNATIIDCSFFDNASNLYAGAVLDRSGGTTTIRGSLFVGNSAIYGGAVQGIDPNNTLAISNTTFVRNTAVQIGGAIVRDSTGSATLDHVTFVENTAGSTAGALYWSGGTRSIRNSLFGGNTAPSNADCLGDATGSNTIQQAGGCTFTGSGNQVGVNPLVGPLANSGGVTATVPVLASSPAIGVSDCTDNALATVTTDQRGFARPSANCTVGAYEYRIPKVIVDAITEPAGSNCTDGGYAILSGMDVNLSGTLDANEVTSTDYLCARLAAIQALVRVTAEGIGTNCAAGGQLVETGYDANDNGELDAAELESAFYVCNGEDGTDGQDTLIKTTTELSGNNCGNGGVRIDAGLDNGSGGGVARNGTLEPGEITSTSYACNGSDGYSSLVTVGAEAAGTNCAYGGQVIKVGLDNGDGGETARDGVLGAGEVDVTSYVCDGSDGADGTNGLNGKDGEDGKDGGCNAAGNTPLGALPMLFVLLLVAQRRTRDLRA